MYSLKNNKGKVIANTSVNVVDNIHILRSYDTIIAKYDYNTNKLQINGWFSNTSQTHLNAFLEFHNLPTMTKKEIQNYKNA